MRSPKAKKLRIKVGPDGVVVVLPEGRDDREATAFISNQRAWVAEQLVRVHQLDGLRRRSAQDDEQILFRGDTVALRVVHLQAWRAPNKVAIEQGAITVICKPGSKTALARSLENWLRKQARERIEQHIAEIGKRLKRAPNRLYVMGQRTKWGNCSALGQSVVQLAARDGPGLRAALHRHARDGASGRARPFPQVLADSAEPVPRDSTSAAVACGHAEWLSIAPASTRTGCLI